MNQSVDLPIANRNEIVARYRHYRTVSRKLNAKLVRRLSKEALHEGAKRLGILRRGTLVFNSEDETSVLMDYCIYDVRRNGRNAIEEYLTDSGGRKSQMQPTPTESGRNWGRRKHRWEFPMGESFEALPLGTESQRCPSILRATSATA